MENVAAPAVTAIKDNLSSSSTYTFGSTGIIYNSQQWEEEQSSAFKSWLNHLFHPTPEIDVVDVEQRYEELKAATALFNSRRMTAIRFAVEREVTEGRLAITPREDRRNILDEVYVQEQLSTLLLSYTPRWLQLGLNVVLTPYGDNRFQSNDMTKETLKTIILEQVLSKPSAIQKYTAGKVKTTSGYFDQMLKVEVQQHALSLLLILVFFLDEAKARQLLTEDPCLFEKTSQVKSSQEMLVSLCQDCFAKQRSILNHLEYEGISVSHVQLPLDEYDFCLRNFAVDLKDGVCLAKMVDIVANGCNILSSLRLPADSRQLKMYNVRLALAALRQLGVPNISDITPAHIVDAHQPRIIQLVWSTILYFELPEFRQEIVQYKASRLIQGQFRRILAMKSYHIALRGCKTLQSYFRGAKLRMRVNEMKVAARDIQKIWRGYNAKVLYGFELMGIITVQSSVRRFLARKRVTILAKRSKASIQIQRIWRGYDRKLQFGFLLMDIVTVQSVCRRFLAARIANARLRNIIKIQSAARVWKAMKMISTYQNAIVTIQASMRKSLAANHVAYMRRQTVKAGMVDYSSEDEVINYATNQSRRRGDKVSLIQHVEQVTKCLVDEQIGESVIEEEDYFSISSSSDLGLASEIEREVAAVVIQMYWRRHFVETTFTMTKKAVIKCQSMCRRWISKVKISRRKTARTKELAAIKITSFFRGKYARMKYMKMLAAATTVQIIARGYIAKKVVEEMKCFQIFLTWEYSAKKIQANFRRHICKTVYNAALAGIISLQARVRCIHAKKEVVDLMTVRAQAATLIQKTFRSFYVSSSFFLFKCAVATIQSAFRRRILELKYHTMKNAAVRIQSKVRAKQASSSFLIHMKSVNTLHRFGRKILVALKTKQVAATKIQCVWRGYAANVDFMLLVLATIKVQSFARMRSATITYQKTHDCIVLIQAHFRSILVRKGMSSQQRSSIIMQKVGRGFLARMHKKDQLAAVAVIQHAVRAMLARLHNDIKVFAATEIQRIWRGFSVNVDYMLHVMASMTIQSRYRKVKKMRACFLLSSQLKSSIIIQKAGRGLLARVHKKHALSAVVVIQRAARVLIASSRNQEIRIIAAREIQRIWRGFHIHVEYMLQVMAAIRIQSTVRRFLVKSVPSLIARMNGDVTVSQVNNVDEPKAQTYQTRVNRPESILKNQEEHPKVNVNPLRRDIGVVTYESKSKREDNNVIAIPKIITAALYAETPNKIHVRNLSKYEKHTAKVIKILRKSELFFEVTEASFILQKTTRKSIDSCRLLLKARAQDNLLSLLGWCNRSSPHLELVHIILHIFTNISRHPSTLAMLVTKESFSTIVDVIQMFRDKEDIFALSSSLLETIVQSDAFILSEYSSHEQQKCLRAVLSLSRNRPSARSCPQFDKGIASLENVIRIIEGRAISPKTKCPYCDREFT
jgi:abnormal spindle-like microcephaly-associated protein